MGPICRYPPGQLGCGMRAITLISKSKPASQVMRGRYYVVDRLFERAELRLGAKAQQVVTISRVGEERSRDQREGRRS